MNRATLFALLIACALWALSACAPKPDDADRIQGEWSIKSAELAGAVLPISMFGGNTLKLKDGRYEFQSDVGKYVLMPDSSPAALDVVGVEGPNAGKIIPAIYILDSNTLLICYDLSGTIRPAVFKTQPKTKQFLARYHRLP